MVRKHQYSAQVTWTGNRGSGTSGYREYDRSYEVAAEGKAAIRGSADPAFRGDRSCWNPEELLVASLAACHQLWYLHLCADAGVVVLAYEDHAQGVMEEQGSGSGQFAEVTLQPLVTISRTSDAALALELHEKAHQMCFVARSVNFPVRCAPMIAREGDGGFAE